MDKNDSDNNIIITISVVIVVITPITNRYMMIGNWWISRIEVKRSNWAENWNTNSLNC